MEEIGVDALREAADRATSLAARAGCIPAGTAAIVAHAAAAAAACQSLAAVALAGARGVRLAAATIAVAVTGVRQRAADDLVVRIATAVPVPRALPPAIGAGGPCILRPEASEQAANAANGEAAQSLAASGGVAQPVDDSRQSIKRCTVHSWLLDTLLPGNPAIGCALLLSTTRAMTEPCRGGRTRPCPVVVQTPVGNVVSDDESATA